MPTTPLHAQDLACIDYSAQPQLMSALVLPQGAATEIVTLGSIAYVSVAGFGFVIVDWSAPDDPQIVTAVPVPGGVQAMDRGPFALYVIGSAGQLLIFDLADPLAPVEIGGSPAVQSAVDIAVVGAHAFTTLVDGGLQVVYLDNPLDPAPGTALPLADGNRAIAVHDNHAYVVGVGTLDHAFGAFYVVDLTNPDVPEMLGSHITDGTGAGWYDKYLDVCAGPGGVFLVHESSSYDWDSGYTYLNRYLRKIDLSNPASPLPDNAVVSAVEHLTGIGVGDLFFGVAHATGPQDPWCPDCDWEDSRLVVQWTDAAHNDRPPFNLPLPDDAVTVTWASGHLLVAGGNAGLLIYSAPMVAPAAQSTIGDGVMPSHRVSGQTVCVDGDRLLVGYCHVGGCYPGDETYGQIDIYDLSSGAPTGPTGSWGQLYFCPTGPLVFVDQNHFYTGHSIFEVTELGDIENVGVVSPGFNQAVLSGSYLVGRNSNDLRSWNVTDPANPVLVDELSVGESLRDLAAAGDLIYAITSLPLYTVRVSAEGDLILLDYQFLPCLVSALWTDGDHLVVGGEDGELLFYTISSETDLTLLAELDLGAPVADIDLGTQLYAALNEGGWAIIDVSDWSAPSVTGQLNGYEATRVIPADDALVLLNRCVGDVFVTGQACTEVTAIEEDLAELIPHAPVVQIEDVWPNPANPRISVAFHLARAGTVTAEVLDLAGRRVAILSEGPREAGRHVLQWDGRGTDGRQAAAGAYLVRISTNGESSVGKALLVR